MSLLTLRFLVALLVSLVLHGLVAVALIGLSMGESRAIPAVHLEISHVELSDAELPDPDAPANTPATTAVQSASPASVQPQFIDHSHVTPQDQRQLSISLPQPAPRQATIDAPPRPEQAIRPDYPRTARLRGEEGDVTLEIEVSPAGTVENVRIAQSSGHADLDRAAHEAVAAARFTPAIVSGRAVAASARLTLQFRLK